MKDPRFSVVICNYNYARFVGAAIESCLAQDYPAERVEVIVVDDGSTDDSREVIRAYCRDGRVRLVSQPNRGHGAAFAAGVARAGGDFVCLLDSDDFYLPEKLSRVASALEALSPLPPDFMLCHEVALYDESAGAVTGETWFQIVGVSGSWATAHIDQIELQFPFAIPCGQVYSRALIERIFEGFPASDWRQAAESALAHCAVLTTEAVHYLQEPLACYRVHTANDGASLAGGRYVPKPVWRQRAPKLLRYLERYVETLPLDTVERASRVGYVTRQGRQMSAVPLSRRLREPLMTFVVDGDGDAERLGHTFESIRTQVHRNCEVVLLGATDVAGFREADSIRAVRRVRGETRRTWDRWGAGYRSGEGEFVAFLECGTVLDPSYAERHLRAHRHGVMVNVTSCDARMLSARDEVLADTSFPDHLRSAASGHVPPLAVPLSAAWFPPAPASVLRRSALLDAMFREGAEARDRDLDAHWHWILCLAAHCAAGSLLLRERLVSVRDDTFAVARNHGDPSPPAAAVAELIFGAYCTEFDLLSQVLPGAWHEHFLQRIVEATGNGPRLAAIVRARNAPESLIPALRVV